MREEDKKPGVMLYFEPLRALQKRLSKEEKADLFDAILDYAEDKKPPSFGEGSKELATIWPFIQSLIDRDDAAYYKKVASKKYAKYRFSAKRHNVEPMDREEWEAKGSPAFFEAHPDWYTTFPQDS